MSELKNDCYSSPVNVILHNHQVTHHQVTVSNIQKVYHPPLATSMDSITEYITKEEAEIAGVLTDTSKSRETSTSRYLL